MPRSKYSSEEERREAQRAQRKARADMIKHLLELHRARTSDDRIAVTEKLTLEQNEQLLSNARIRKTMIHTLVSKYTEEVKQALDVYRFLKKD